MLILHNKKALKIIFTLNTINLSINNEFSTETSLTRRKNSIIKLEIHKCEKNGCREVQEEEISKNKIFGANNCEKHCYNYERIPIKEKKQ